MIRRLLFAIARSPVASLFIGTAFARLTWLMPLKRIVEDERAIVFEHPKQFWEIHWLAVPKQRVPTILTCEAIVLRGLLPLIQISAEKLPHPMVLVNGGQYQDVPQMHFHVTSGPDSSGNKWKNTQLATEQVATLTIAPHPQPKRQVHWQVQSVAPPFLSIDWTDSEQSNAAIAALLAARDQAIALELDAFSLLWDSADSQFTVHLVSGNQVDAR
ncbi:MAG: hypothetical protein ACPG8W_21195 [Candidatus Promineifilaceae bacterium]